MSRSLSIVIPARNEATRLPTTLVAARAFAHERGFELEILVADDGSRDATCELAELGGARVLRSPAWRGPGAAVRAGMLAATGDRLLLCDADGAVPFEDLFLLWGALDAGADVAIGSRGLSSSRVEVQQPAHRVLIGKGWGRVVRTLLPTGVRDTQCGFKLFRRDAAHLLFSQARSTSFAFHVEVLALARRAGMRVDEIPVRWRDQPGSKIALWRDPAAMLLDLTAAAWRLRRRSALAAPALHLP